MENGAIGTTREHPGADLHNTPWVGRGDHVWREGLERDQLAIEHLSRKLRFHEGVHSGASTTVVGLDRRPEPQFGHCGQDGVGFTHDALRMLQMTRRIERNGQIERCTGARPRGCEDFMNILHAGGEHSCLAREVVRCK